jgi:uncharacterized membrane protein
VEKSLLANILAGEAEIASAIVAGVFFSVAVSVIPALLPLSPDRYIESHIALGKGYHPVMPIIVNVSTVVEIVLAIVAPTPTSRALFIAGIVLFVGVQAVSHLLNVPINRRVRAMDAGSVAVGWEDPRPLWRRWHTLRFTIAMILLLVNTAALLSLHR